MSGPAALGGPDALAAAWARVTEPLRLPVEDWEVTDAEAALSQRHLAELDDATFDQVVHRMALVEDAKFLRRLLTETEEEVEAPESVRAFVARLAGKGAPGTLRAAVGALRRHGLGRLLEALARVEPPIARRFVHEAGGADAVAAAAIDEAIRARAAEDVRAMASLRTGLRALLRVAPPADAALRDFAVRFTAYPRSWGALWAGSVAAGIDRAASADEAEGNIYEPPSGLDLPYDDDFSRALVDAVRRHRPHAPPVFQTDY